jgi:hypothetical protein
MLTSVGHGADPTGINETMLKPRGGAICVSYGGGSSAEMCGFALGLVGGNKQGECRGKDAFHNRNHSKNPTSAY